MQRIFRQEYFVSDTAANAIESVIQKAQLSSYLGELCFFACYFFGHCIQSIEL